MNPLFPNFLHGGDYNPEQWLDYPGILEKDVQLMREAHVNCVSVGIFSWTRLEPEEGCYQFDWLADIIDRLYQNGIYTVLATPSGAKPAWMSQKYPEIRRCSASLIRDLHGARHNHCYTSPVYRNKVHAIDTALAERFSHHPGVILWHISNEFNGDCYCPLCQEAFRNWLRDRYQTLDALNHAYWMEFWSHRYTDWSQVEAPVPNGEMSVHGLNLDWKRFVTDQTADFVRLERDAVKAVNPELPVTINMMGYYPGLNYFKFKDLVDIVSWDSYPKWNQNATETSVGQITAFAHDLMRSIQRKPFLLMESCPSATNWQDVSRLKRPGVHMLSEMQAVAHGSNSVQYFQWRKSRGSSEKLHGAVVDHYGESDTRVFRDVTAVGKRLEGLQALLATCPRPEVAVLFDWENRWAMEDAQGPRNCGIHYEETVFAYHRAFWKLGVPVDVIDEECSFDRYKVLVLPMAYLLRKGFADRVREFVKNGGILVGTYWSGIVNETDLCWLGGWPGDGLMEVFGLRSEEIDGLYDGQSNRMVITDGSLPRQEYQLSELCDLIHCTTARTLAVYGEDFYQGMPALTVNDFGNGKAYYIAAHAEDAFLSDFATTLVKEVGLTRSLDADLPEGVSANRRHGVRDAILVLNFTPTTQTVPLHREYSNWETGESVTDTLVLAPYEVKILAEVE